MEFDSDQPSAPFATIEVNLSFRVRSSNAPCKRIRRVWMSPRTIKHGSTAPDSHRSFTSRPRRGLTLSHSLVQPRHEVDVVFPVLHNQDVDQFSARRQLLVDSDVADGTVPEEGREREAPGEGQAETSSKLGALLVVLAPFAIVAWVAIGLSIYWLIT